MLQAIFYPVQGKEPSIRQLALLAFPEHNNLNLKLDDALLRPRARVPPPSSKCTHMQGVHESKGVTDAYLNLETLIQKVVSPYLGTYGLYSNDGPPVTLQKRMFRRCPKSGEILTKNPVVRSKKLQQPSSDASRGNMKRRPGDQRRWNRRHSVSEMTSSWKFRISALDSISPNSNANENQQGLFGAQRSTDNLSRDIALHPPPSSSPETIVDQILESIDRTRKGFLSISVEDVQSPQATTVEINRQPHVNWFISLTYFLPLRHVKTVM
ncbi:hypothetical protein GDO86_019934 [Hymenochirus boettgeri]|uniref:Uncharacterized protein n=1 Tax=Hymenochirus boettgeri TaxID=247094 RepID=A0A8T2ICQ3_9PIPI|nr:hypothetical protein GDO86_019934 [Hymenochirus boettgeri]